MDSKKRPLLVESEEEREEEEEEEQKEELWMKKDVILWKNFRTRKFVSDEVTFII